jgi:hypothetical protein
LGLAEFFDFKIIWLLFAGLAAIGVGDCFLQISRSYEKFRELASLRHDLKERVERQIRQLEGVEFSEDTISSKKVAPTSAGEGSRFLLRIEEVSRFRQIKTK